MQVNIKNLIDDVHCYKTVRELRWPEGPRCPFCESGQIIKRGFDEKESARQRYGAKNAQNVLMIFLKQFFQVTINPLKSGFCAVFHGVEPF